MKRILLAGACAQILIAASGIAAPAMAQDKSSGIETITVTAQKRSESAQNVPIALSVLTSEDLLKQGITKINGLQYATPSLEVVPAFGSGQAEFRLRGVGFDDYASNNSSTVGVYVDEVAYPIPAQTQGAIFDLQRTEVLYGPQGTLYGVNTTGGAINFITNKPQDDFGFGLTADYDSHNEFIGNGYITGQLADGLDGRLAFLTDQGGSWQKNINTGQSYGKKDSTSVRGELQWTINDRWNVLFEGHYSSDRSQPTGLYLFDPILSSNPNNLTGVTIPAFTDTKKTAWGGSATFETATGITPDQAPFHRTNADGVNMQVHGDLGFGTLTSITSYEDLHRREYNDWDASAFALAGTYFDTTAHVFSQELRLASNGDGPFSWMIGGYYSHQVMDEIFDSDFADSLGLVTDTRYTQHVESKAVFTQEEYQINDKLKVIGGLRYNSESRSIGNFVLNGIFLPGAPTIPLTPSVGQSVTNNRLSGKGEIEYKPDENVMLYASVSEGIKSGGFTTYNGSQAAPPLKPEVLWAYEAGVKSNLLDDTLQLNGSVFWYHYENQQIQSAVWGTTGPVGSLVNAPKSHVYGGELSAIWQPIDALKITQSVGWKDGKFDQFDNFLDIPASVAACVPAAICVPPAGNAIYDNKKGARIGFPPLSYNGSIDYTWQLPGYTLDTGFDWVFHDHLNPLLLGPVYYVKSYWLTDVNITLSPNDGPWAATVYCHNCTNTKYDTTRNFFLPGIDIAQRGEPATVGVRLDYKY
jgi:outer membrane receptor protein involved in Fe transport